MIAPQPKPRPRALEKADRDKARAKLDRAENAKVRKRSGRRCERIQQYPVRDSSATYVMRCHRAAQGEPHHLKKGYGVRNRGDSILARWKLAVCNGPNSCHDLITRHILVPVDPQADAARVVYERRR